MKKIYLAALAASTALASPAAAQDGNFSGVRVEARVGWDNARSTLAPGSGSVEEDEAEAGEGAENSASGSGVSYGLEAGYDFQLGDSSILLGAYGGFELVNNEMCAPVIEGDLRCLETDRNLYAGVRAGLVLNRNLLVYARGGYTNGQFGISYDEDVEDDHNERLELTENRDGYHVGAGVEVAFGPNVYGKVEYLYTGYGTLALTSGEPDIIMAGADVNVDRHQVLTGLGFRF